MNKSSSLDSCDIDANVLLAQHQDCDYRYEPLSESKQEPTPLCQINAGYLIAIGWNVEVIVVVDLESVTVKMSV